SKIIYFSDDNTEKFLLEKNPDNYFQEWSNLFKPRLTVPCGKRTGYQYDISLQSVEHPDDLFLLFLLFAFLLENHDCQIFDLTAQKSISAKEINRTVERGTLQLKQLINWHHVSDGTSRSWFHTNGMEKVGLSNLETYFFHKYEEIEKYQKLFLELFNYKLEHGSSTPLPAIYSSCIILTRQQIFRQLPDSIRKMFKNHGNDYLAVVQKDFFD
ncbi:MAG: hypothetical protein PF689_10640, partial [Deltaproteobacteria bacterium]|nr:hypothetical protein [Deltaproteobacteria bacterium]